MGGLLVALLHFIVQDVIVYVLYYKTPLTSVFQYVASGLMGMAAFDGGQATALLGALIHIFNSPVIAGVFFLAVDRIPWLRRNLIIGSMLYGFGVFIVMDFVVVPLSAAPLLPVTTGDLIELFLEHILFVGLPLGLLARRSA